MLSHFKNLSKFTLPLSNIYLPLNKFSVSSDEEVAQKGARRSKKIQPPQKLKKVALVLSGSGVYDGSEVTEAVSFLISFGSRKLKYQCFAPNKDQSEVINHLTGEVQKEKRNVLVESARIARGNVKDLKELSSEDYDAIFFPGGFGAAKNLSNFATKGTELLVDPEVERVLKDFHSNSKPIGLACISPVLAAKVFGTSDKIKITLGNKGEGWPYKDAIDAVEKLGATHIAKQVLSYYADTRNLVFTTPAFMKETTNFSEISTGIDNLVGGIEKTLTEIREATKAKKEQKKLKKEEQNKQ